MANPNEAWKSVIDADLNDAARTEGTGSGPIPDGAYPAHVTGVETKTFMSGAKGIQVTFALDVEGELSNREIRDYFVVVAKDGKPNRFGAARVKKLLLECGLSSDQILKFKYPEFDKKQLGGFKDILEKEMTVEIKAQENKSGPHAGKKFARVISFANRNS